MELINASSGTISLSSLASKSCRSTEADGSIIISELKKTIEIQEQKLNHLEEIVK